ncbi:O-antigen ligase family protein [Pelotomaculum propionicicum]|uniref:O-antigen ligase family protein n=1 Tax=Pelotomaculum propionicicum TaxID=258475 RepID=UPI003B800EAB
MRNLSFWLLLILVFVIPWENAVTFEGLGTISRFLGLFLFVAWFTCTLFSCRVRRPHLFHVFVGAFVLWNAAGLFWSVDPDATIKRAMTFIQLGMLTFIIWDLNRTAPAIRSVLQAYIFGACVSVGSIIYNFLLNQEVGFGRFAAAGFDPNDIGVIIAIGIPLAWYLAFVQPGRHRALAWLNYAYIPLAVFGVLLTASRDASLALIPSIFFMLWSLRKLDLSRRVAVITALLCSAWLIYSIVPAYSLERLASTTNEVTQGNLNSRTLIWEAGLRVYHDSPLWGAGGGAYPYVVQPVLGREVVAHNSFLSVLVECGIIGLCLFLGVLLSALRSANRHDLMQRAMWLAVIAVIVLGASALTWEYRKPLWLFMTLVVASSSILLSENREESGMEQHMLEGGVS